MFCYEFRMSCGIHTTSTEHFSFFFINQTQFVWKSFTFWKCDIYVKSIRNTWTDVHQNSHFGHHITLSLVQRDVTHGSILNCCHLKSCDHSWPVILMKCSASQFPCLLSSLTLYDCSFTKNCAVFLLFFHPSLKVFPLSWWLYFSLPITKASSYLHLAFGDGTNDTQRFLTGEKLKPFWDTVGMLQGSVSFD